MPQATQYPGFQPYVPPNQVDPEALAASTKKILGNAIPGLDNLTGAASSNTGALMSGLPSPNPVRRANAYFGSISGMPGSDFVRNRGFDLYGEKADSYQARGFNDFLNLLKGVSGTIAPTTGETTGALMQNQNISQRGNEFNSGAGQQNQQAAQQLRSQRSVEPDGYTEFNTLGMTPLFGRGSRRPF